VLVPKYLAADVSWGWTVQTLWY